MIRKWCRFAYACWRKAQYYISRNYFTVNINNINDLRFEDTDVLSGVEYKYSVQANGEFGLVSDRTDEASLTIPKSKSQQ